MKDNFKKNNLEDLAIFGGQKMITKDFKKYNPIGEEEIKAAKDVVSTGVLSQFIGKWGPDFLGGPKVKEFEKECEIFFNVKHAITVNSWTSGLITAIGALDIEPGDEIIVTPWTMCASATAILHWNAIPVFADIDKETYCLCPKSIEKNISPFTKAIMSVDIGGHPADIDLINKIAKKYDLKVISDTAQAPGTFYKGKMAGTLTDIGGYSLNYHKHIHTGEGGILVTNDDYLANRMRLIRNHAEASMDDINLPNINNMLGHNFRLGEIECAIGIEQLKKLKKFVHSRQIAASKLNKGLSNLKGLKIPSVANDCTHAYYLYFMQIKYKEIGISRDKIFDALVAEGVPGLSKTFANLHLLPMYQKKIAYGKNGFPWTSDICKREVNYKKGICPVAEELHDRSYIGFQMCLFELSDEEIELIVSAFKKVWNNLNLLKL